MSEISDRLQIIINERFNRNKAAFSRAVDISPTTLASYFDVKKKSKPSSDILQKIVEVTGVYALWLLTGKGSPFAEEVGTEIHYNSDNYIGGDNNKIGSDNNGNANGENSRVYNMPCPDDATHIRELEKEIENLKGELVHKNDLIEQMKKTEESQDKRIEEYRERVDELKERISELRTHKK